MNLEFRIAKTEDIPSIVTLCNECFFEETPLEFATKVWEKTKDDPNQIYIVGFLNGILVAHAKVTIIPTIFEAMNTYAILNHVCVKPEYRQHSIATRMLDYISGICQKRGCISLKLWSNNFRKPAHACYKKYGFEPNDAVFFSKEIKEEII